MRSSTWLVKVALLSNLAALSAGCNDDTVEILACEGNCMCVEETRTCSCLGGTECIIEGANDVTLICEGNADCALRCEDDCNVQCPGTSICEVIMGGDSFARCNGTGRCDVTCNGDCQVECTGNEECTVRCADDVDCEIIGCGEAIDCDDQNAQACRTACPPPLTE